MVQEPPAEIDLGQVFGVLRRGRLPLLLGSLLIGVAAVGGSFLITPKFTATVTILPPQQAQSTAAALLGSSGLAGLAGGAGVLAGLKNPSDQWVGMLQSRTIADALIAQFKLKDRYELEFMDEVRNELDDRTNIVIGKDSLISIHVSDPDPAVSVKMASTYVDELRKMSKLLAVGEAAQRRVFFEQQMLNAKDRLIKADLALQETGVGEGILKSVPEAAVAGFADLKSKLAELQMKVIVLRGSLTENSPELQSALRQQGELRAQLTRLESTSPTGQGKAELYLARYRDVKYYEALMEIMARQYELARADEAREGALIQVIDEPTVPERKSSPKRAVMGLVATGIGFIVIAATLLVRDSRRRQRVGAAAPGARPA